MFVAVHLGAAPEMLPEGRALREALRQEAARVSKPEWRPMLEFLAELHGRSVLPAVAHLPEPYESIGPGYQDGRVFGHIDLAHIRLDTLRASPAHVRAQTRNELAGQQHDGLIPGIIIFGADGKPWWKTFKGFPPLWVVVVDDYVQHTGEEGFLRQCLPALERQIQWFEAKRRAPDGGFYYLDLVEKTWESGMDEGIRYDVRPAQPAAAVDACAHLYSLYECAARWSERLGIPAGRWRTKAEDLRAFIRTRLWHDGDGFFHDAWRLERPQRELAFEGMWPVVVGAATPEQARRVIREHLLNPPEFLSPHPIATVALKDPKHELRMWRGPAWNCMTYWAARGCARYGETAGARRILEAALDDTAQQFQRTGTLWEFYHPSAGEPESLRRKASGRNQPYRDYVGHNPLFAMVDLWRLCQEAGAVR
jgi:hypothetical protein